MGKLITSVTRGNILLSFKTKFATLASSSNKQLNAPFTVHFFYKKVNNVCGKFSRITRY